MLRIKLIKYSKSVIFGWALSYAIIFIIPISMFLYGTTVTSKLIRKEVSHSNMQILDNMSRNMDDQITALYEAFRYTFTNNVFTKLASANQKDSSFYNNAYNLQRSLGSYHTANNNISIIVYFHRWEYIVSNSTSNELEPLYCMLKTYGLTLNKEVWTEKLAAEYNNYFFTSDLSLNSRDNHLVYACTIRLSGHPITIFALTSYSSLAENTQLLQDSVLLLSNKEGKIQESFGNKSVFASLDKVILHEEYME